MRHRLMLLVPVSALFLVASAAAQTVTITDLGTLGGAVSEAVAVNSSRDVVGWSEAASAAQHATRWVSGKPELIQDLGTLCGPGCPFDARSMARDINDAGTIVGESEDATGARQGFIWTELAGMQPLPPLPGHSSSSAYAINNVGWVVGMSRGGGSAAAVVWIGGVPADLGTTGISPLPGATMIARDVNDAKQVVGEYWTSTGELHAFYYEDGLMTDIHPKGNCNQSEAISINAFGEVAGTALAFVSGACRLRAFKWSPAPALVPADLGALPSPTPQSSTGFHGAADSGVVAGESVDGCPVPQAVLFTGAGSMIALGALPRPPGPFCPASTAHAMNHAWDVVGTSIAGFSQHAVRWKITWP